MPLDTPSARRRLRDFDLSGLFIEDLGWDHPGPSLNIPVSDQTFVLRAIAQKRGVQVFECAPGPDGEIPERTVRQKLDREVTKAAHEHLIVFTDEAHKHQTWQWVAREPGKPAALREHAYVAGQAADSLIQKLDRLQIPISEEEAINVMGVALKLKDAFDKDRVTKRFYDRFKTEHQAFLAFITGIREVADREWYASLMLNRLMFIYFIQKKGFLDDDTDYLKIRLRRVQTQRGTGSFLSFYRYFLRRLFHEGLSAPEAERPAELDTLIGRVPYLNGGLFDVHQLEEQNPEIDIPDEAFNKLFAFFDSYHWHLDDRPLSEGNEINPDVLGYIFEKYINQKQMGAYYTKEDITEYISKNTIVPFLLDAAAKECAIAFHPGEGSVWRLLQNDPDRYIYPSVRYGVGEPLPAEIAAGINDVSKRDDWNRPAPARFALATETWREHIARRERCEELWLKLAEGHVTAFNDLVTLNLNIRQFIQDAVEQSEGPELLRAFFSAIEKVTVLDPTCGSGAFLFAALNILQPLYDACLERMEAFLVDLDTLQPEHDQRRLADFRRILTNVAKHPNREYFVLKSIILNNLYGVDIMEEAVEICKLRLFLRLVAQVDTYDQIEPLPDIDFNIRAGNTLVGFATNEQARRALAAKLDFDSALPVILESAELASRAFGRFQQMQNEEGMQHSEFVAAKAGLRSRLTDLRLQLDGYLSNDYGVNPTAPAFAHWRRAHEPFHWFVEFFEVVTTRGGFDAIIGNPPWREYSSVRNEYLIKGLSTESCGNLYGYCAERSLQLRSPLGRFSFIVQLPLMSSPRMGVVRRMLLEHSGVVHMIPFDDRPGKLFDGLQNCRSVIFIAAGRPATSDAYSVFTADYQRWKTETRHDLFESVSFVKAPESTLSAPLPKLEGPLHLSTIQKITAQKSKFGEHVRARRTDNFVFYQESARYWVKAQAGLPHYAKDGSTAPPSHGRFLFFDSADEANIACALLNSSLFYIYFVSYGDCFHVNDSLVDSFPLPVAVFADRELAALGASLAQDLEANAQTKEIRTKDGSTISYAEFQVNKSKGLIDRIDSVIGSQLGFTPEEIDFVQNFDVKFRLSGEPEALE